MQPVLQSAGAWEGHDGRGRDQGRVRSARWRVEQEVEGEKLVTRHILEQTRRNSDDLAAIKIAGLVRDLPKIVAEAARDIRPKRGRKT
jgi:hypothetical protein